MKIQKLAALLLTIPLSFGASQAALADPLLKPALPEQYDQIESAVELKESTEIGEIQFSAASAKTWRPGEPRAWSRTRWP